MKRIVKGNDFTLRIPVAKVVEGHSEQDTPRERVGGRVKRCI